ncbi:DNA polymerase III subunit gamma and tau, partial [Streptomyces sp. NPDC058423]
GQGARPSAAPEPSAAAPAPAPAAAAPASPPQGVAPAAAQGAAQVRNMWPEILEAVKNRRRFTWILLSQNAQVAGFDGTTLQLGFINAGARDNFASSGSEDVLRQALAEQFNVQWKIEAIIDPSGGGGQLPSGPGGSSGGGYGGGYGAPAGRPAQSPSAASPAPQPSQAPRAPQQPAAPSSPPPAGGTGGPAPQQGSSAAQSARAAAPQAPPPPPPVALEDDIPEEDDPDLVDSALSGHDLIVRELGATVVEEYTNE